MIPEMESTWSWFDEVLGATSLAHLRCYCMTVGAEP
jgi:hypothetical protein